MICSCQHCHLEFWRYRRDWPPPGFCSYPHFLAGAKRLPAPAPDLPEEILREIKRHRWEAHDTTSMLAWFECPRCEELEGAYGEAISYHVSRITAEIVGDAERLRLRSTISEAANV